MISARVRVKELLGKKPDGVLPPVTFPIVVANYAAHLAGERLSRTVCDAGVLSRVLDNSYHIFGYDLILVFSDVLVEAEAMGCEVEFLDDEPPLLKWPAGTKARLAEPARDGRLPVVLEAAERLMAKLGQEVFILVSLKGPFSLASFLAGPEGFLKDLLEEPLRAQGLLRLATENQKRFARAIVRAGGVPFIGDPMASGSIISPEQFAGFALPYLKELIAEIHALGIWTGLHICGDTMKILRMMKESGADILSIDEMPMGVVRSELGQDAVIMGNIPTRLVLEGTWAMVEKAARDCLTRAWPRIILATACDVPVAAPMENVRAVVRAARQWQRYC